MTDFDYGAEMLESWRRREHELDDDRKTQELLAGEHRTDWKPAKRLTRADVWRKHRPSIAWKLAVLERDQGCCVHSNPAECGEDGRGQLWVSHHVVYQQELRRNRPELLWHPLSGMGVCGLAHTRHHNRSRPIRQAEIPPQVFAFLAEQGYGRYLERFYDLDWPARTGEETET